MEEIQEAVVVEVLGPVVFVARLEAGRIAAENPYACSLVGNKYREGKPVVGDRVRFAIHSEHVQGRDYQGIIRDILPRTSLVERLEPGGKRARSLVANLDTLVVVASASAPPFRPGLIDRYLVCAHHWGIEPLIVVNKWELAGEKEPLYVQLYEALGYRCITASAYEGLGIKLIESYLCERASAMLGHSGVGKSSLLNRLFPDANLAIGELSFQSQRGRHTTSSSRLLPFASGGFVIDTPGVREFGITGIKPLELSSCFPEFYEFTQKCRFQPCSHTHEPDCAVKAGVECDDLAAFRYHAYLKMYAELEQLAAANYGN